MSRGTRLRPVSLRHVTENPHGKRYPVYSAADDRDGDILMAEVQHLGKRRVERKRQFLSFRLLLLSVFNLSPRFFASSLVLPQQFAHVLAQNNTYPKSESSYLRVLQVSEQSSYFPHPSCASGSRRGFVCYAVHQAERATRIISISPLLLR